MSQNAIGLVIKISICALAIALVTGMAGSVFARPAANLDQLRNGSDVDPNNPAEWANGNIGSETGHYDEGYSIAYRAVMTDLPINTSIGLLIGYDIKHSDKHAVDYLTYYDRINDPSHQASFSHSPETIDPLTDVPAVGPTTSTLQIPAPILNINVDPDLSGPRPSQPMPLASYNRLAPEERVMTLFGGTIDSITIASSGDLNASQSEAQLRVWFRTEQSTAVLAWGGHIGWRAEWGYPGDPRSAGGISGAPYHMRLLDWNLRNLGNQDRSMSAIAVFVPPVVCGVSPTSQTVCEGANATFVEITSAGTGPFTYCWQFNGEGLCLSTDSMLTISNATSEDGGTYRVIVTDFNNKVDTCEVELNVDEKPVCNITGDNEICTGVTTEFCATADMASYLWSGPEDNGATDQCIIISTAGEYQVIITNANGCADTCTRILSVYSQPACSIDGDSTICAGFTTEFCATDDMASYLWNGPEDDGATANCITIGTAGEYRVIITDENGCVDTCTKILVVNPQPVCSITGDDEICAGFTSEFCATAGMTSYLWSGPEDNGATTQCITVGTAGEYRLIITDESGCADTCLKTLTVHEQPVCSISGPESICAGVSVELCATAGMESYRWSTGQTTQCITVDAEGQYQVIVTDEYGCSDTSSQYVEIHDQPLCEISGPSQTCIGFPADLCATDSMVSYLWSGPEDNGATTRCINVNTEGEYRVIVTDAYGCADTCAHHLDVTTQPVCNISGDGEICEGFTTDFCATPDMATYLWSGPENDGAITRCISISTAGTYQVIVADANGCVDTCSKILTVHPQPIAGITGSEEVCQGFKVDLCATEGIFSYLWSGPENNGDTTRCINVGAEGNYRVIITDEYGCADTSIHELEVHDQPVCGITGDNDICEGTTTEFCASEGMASYLWSGPEDNGSTSRCIEVGTPGTYRVIITDANGCADTCSRTLTFDHPSFCSISPRRDLICDGDSATFCALDDMVSYMWTGPDGFSSSEQCITAYLTGVYKVVVANIEGCVDSCEASLRTIDCDGPEYCSLTQGAYGNRNGRFNGMRRLELIQSLLADSALVIGWPGRSVTIDYDAAECIIKRLPAGSSPISLPNELGDAILDPDHCQTSPVELPLQNERFKNVFLGQLITLSLNMRLPCHLGEMELCPEIAVRKAHYGDDGLPCTNDDYIDLDPDVEDIIYRIPLSVFYALDSLGLDHNVYGLAELANRAIALEYSGGALIPNIHAAVSAINELFDECAFVIYCGPVRNSVLPVIINYYEVSSIETPQAPIPTELFLAQCYPNPFNAVTNIEYGLPEDAYVAITIYDLLGRRIATLAGEQQAAGYHHVYWNAGNQPSGIYFYRIQAGQFAETKKMLMIK